MSDETITITIPVKQATQTHVEHLQATLAKRNAEIERLIERVKEAEAGEPNQSVLQAEYKRGWEAAADHMMVLTSETARSLGKLRQDAWDIYLDAQKRI